jgi:hypothetical protein
MKTQVKAPILVAVGVLFVGGIVYWGIKSVGDAGSLDHGQIKYTPGVPPWLEKDPSKKGPGGTPGASGSAAPGTQGMPVGPPSIDNGKK